MAKRVMILYITYQSGHHAAGRALEKAVHAVDPLSSVSTIDSFRYTNPFLSRASSSLYLYVLWGVPVVWQYLYDNPLVAARVSRFRDALYRFNSRKIATLLRKFRPDVVVCTQALPCGMVSDFKRSRGAPISLVGVLTDYLPHAYWAHKNVDIYVAHTRDARARLIKEGVRPEKIRMHGIPINPTFAEETERTAKNLLPGFKKDLPAALVMGGGRGLGPLRDVLLALENCRADFQVIAVTGANRRLFRWLLENKKRFKKPLVVRGYVNNVRDLMRISSLIITKPGGLTTAAQWAKG